MFIHRVQRYCAFCKTSRKIYAKKHATVYDALSCALLSALLTVGIWQKFDPRAIGFWCFFLILAEVAVQLRHRLSLVCQYCGFDPILYLKSHEQAAERVKNHLALRREDPDFLLSEKPHFNLSRKKISKDLVLNKDSGNLSKSAAKDRPGNRFSARI